ncbi:5-aminolevulic acid synthase [Pseudorhodobacter sp.]|uniref:5-aminolevulic acid synthase n=1 Tax=Pseudorhodobacter sp. TaxID=1934400 RepID=UPI0026489CD5|nr:5-aminolevulic acid synthase [Pseudorhodobacter sp.]MDN5788231.1 5-aminolevulic acid synthase [Pseudorhodobacter sp.]
MQMVFAMERGALALGFAGVIWAAASAAFADPVSGKEAAKMLFSPKGSELLMYKVEGLSEDSARLLQQVAKDYAYYAAVAIAPEEELLKSEATILVANHNSVEAASAAALAGCNKARTKGTECVVAAVVRPAKWKAQPLQLSVEGTVAFKADYGKSGERAMAASASTGFFALASGPGAAAAAIAACNAKGATDCETVIADAS